MVKRYPKSPVNAVDGVSFAVEAGEVFGLLGPNGAGKCSSSRSSYCSSWGCAASTAARLTEQRELLRSGGRNTRTVRVRLVVLILGAATALVTASGATAKEFRPGDLRLCSHHRCVSITDQPVLNQLGAFYYTGESSPPKIRAPRLGAHAFQLRFSDGYVTGVVGGAKLNRFLSFGVNLGRFAPGQWYRFPVAVAQELTIIAAPLEPLRVSRWMLARSR